MKQASLFANADGFFSCEENMEFFFNMFNEAYN